MVFGCRRTLPGSAGRKGGSRSGGRRPAHECGLIWLFNSRAAPRPRHLTADVAEALRSALRLHGAFEVEDRALHRLQDDLLSTQVKGDPISKVQTQLIAQGLRDCDLAFTGESREGHGSVSPSRQRPRYPLDLAQPADVD